MTGEVLFPSPATEMGVSEDDFTQMRGRLQIRSLFEAVGYRYKIGKFNAIYNRAKELNPAGIRGDDCVSVRHF